MKIIDFKAEADDSGRPPRNKYVRQFLDLGANQAMSFDNYEEMRRVYFSVLSYCKNRKLKDRPRQFSSTTDSQYVIWRDYGEGNT